MTDTDKKMETGVATAINEFCPRSGKPVSSDSFTRYRGHTVGFCNTHCRDDFAQNISERPDDRAAFDKIIDQLNGK